MMLIVDKKSRFVLPKSVKPGDVLEVMSTGDVIVLHLLKPVLRGHANFSKPGFLGFVGWC
jgi:hypothetical protein